MCECALWLLPTHGAFASMIDALPRVLLQPPMSFSVTRVLKLQMIADGLVASKFVQIPFAFLGLGMGALLAYEVARVLRNGHRKADKNLLAIFPLCSPGPQTYMRAVPKTERLSRAPDDDIIEHLNEIERGCVPPIVTEAIEMMLLQVPQYRSGLKLVERYVYQSDWPFRSSVYAVFPECDGNMSKNDVKSWEQETTLEFELRALPCGRRELLRDPILLTELCMYVSEKIEDALDAPEPAEEDDDN